MITIAIGKAITPIEIESDNVDCADCYFFNEVCKGMPCLPEEREDGLNVIYKEVDMEVGNGNDRN